MNAMQTKSAIDAIATINLSAIKTKLMHVASGEGWSAAHADAVETEYRRFLTLMKLYPNETTAPLVDVDTFWHYHILDTAKYAADCASVFGYFLHHYPYLGLEGEEDEAVREGAGARMQELYAATFGTSMPTATAGAWCGAATAIDASSAWCGATTAVKAAKPAAIAWCGAATSGPAQQAIAWCGSASTAPAASALAWCGAPPATQGKAAVAWCGATTGKAAAPQLAWCGSATAAPVQSAVAWCGAARPTELRINHDITLTVMQAS